MPGPEDAVVEADRAADRGRDQVVPAAAEAQPLLEPHPRPGHGPGGDARRAAPAPAAGTPRAAAATRRARRPPRRPERRRPSAARCAGRAGPGAGRSARTRPCRRPTTSLLVASTAPARRPGSTSSSAGSWTSPPPPETASTQPAKAAARQSSSTSCRPGTGSVRASASTTREQVGEPVRRRRPGRPRRAPSGRRGWRCAAPARRACPTCFAPWMSSNGRSPTNTARAGSVDADGGQRGPERLRVRLGPRDLAGVDRAVDQVAGRRRAGRPARGAPGSTACSTARRP